MKRFVLGCCAGALAAALCSVANGGEVTGIVARLIVRASDGLTYVYIDGTPTGQPACAARGYWMIMDETSEAGRKQYAMLLAAATKGTPVIVTGNNTCTRWPDGEDINYIDLVE